MRETLTNSKRRPNKDYSVHNIANSVSGFYRPNQDEQSENSHLHNESNYAKEINKRFNREHESYENTQLHHTQEE